jgi:hypothetical protein
MSNLSGPILLCCTILVVPSVAVHAAAAIIVKTASVVMFVPSPSEIDQLTDRDISIQDFLAYWIDIQPRLREQLRSVTVFETDANEIVFPDGMVVRSHTPHGFGFIFFAPGKEIRIMDGVMEPDKCLDAASVYFGEEAASVAGLPSKGDRPPRLSGPVVLQTTRTRDLAPPDLAYVPTVAETSKSVSSFAGTWQGTVKQPLARAYTVTMELKPGSVGTPSGSINYPEVNCTGRLILLEEASDHIRFAEKINVGSCVDSGSIVLSIGGTRDGIWEWYDHRGRLGATARLTRTAPATSSLELNETVQDNMVPPSGTEMTKIRRGRVASLSRKSLPRDRLPALPDTPKPGAAAPSELWVFIQPKSYLDTFEFFVDNRVVWNSATEYGTIDKRFQFRPGMHALDLRVWRKGVNRPTSKHWDFEAGDGKLHRLNCTVTLWLSNIQCTIE